MFRSSFGLAFFFFLIITRPTQISGQRSLARLDVTVLVLLRTSAVSSTLRGVLVSGHDLDLEGLAGRNRSVQ